MFEVPFFSFFFLIASLSFSIDNGNLYRDGVALIPLNSHFFFLALSHFLHLFPPVLFFPSFPPLLSLPVTGLLTSFCPRQIPLSLGSVFGGGCLVLVVFCFLFWVFWCFLGGGGLGGGFFFSFLNKPPLFSPPMFSFLLSRCIPRDPPPPFWTSLT